MKYSNIIIAFVAIVAASRQGNAHTLLPASLPKDQALALVLKSVEGGSRLVPAITKLQAEVQARPDDVKAMEQLAQLFIAQARLTSDETLYVRSELCGQLLEAQNPNNPTALLLRGHSLLAMHQFHDAEEIAGRLLKIRQDMQDYALLGDALMEQGQLEAALPMYQAMIDAKPCMPSYSRIAHIRWLKGDVVGAIEMEEQAIACASYRDPEALAWVTARLAFYQWQNDDLELAMQTATRATQIVPDYPHALLVIGRVLLAQGKAVEAVAHLKKAAATLPLPEVQWALADALHLAGQDDEAAIVLASLKQQGAKADPRSFALHLATRGIELDQALDLAKAEVMTRRDVFSWDALAWAQHASGASEAALISTRRALAEGTRDARLFLHAGIIAKAAGEPSLAAEQLGKAQQMRRQLLPSEQRLLDESTAN